MSNKEWHEEIPGNGVLCKNQHGLMTNVIEVVHGFAFNAEEKGLSVRELTPVTAQQWWKFTPWQKMGTAPTNEPLFVKLNSGVCTIASSLNWENNSAVVEWLPLPEANHE